MKSTSILVFIAFFSFATADILVTIPDGTLRGRQEYSQRGISFYVFLQIPYAKPPVGELRFREPQPSEPWDGIRDATYNDKACFNVYNYNNLANISAYEQEDCLYLNVYTPKYPSTNESLPVMYHIYGGGFSDGADHIDYFGPHYLMENDVIVVAVNYRLGPLGFLSTGDTVIPGNFGLKDQQLGLKWVRENIKYFGGDPEKVTIFGQSAGGASVSYHLMSKSSEGLFRAAIAQSGSVLCPWAYQRDSKIVTSRLVNSLNSNFNANATSEDILQFLRTVPAASIITAAHGVYLDTPIDTMIDGLYYSPVIEPEHVTAFITESMYSAIENGRMNRVPLIIGMCTEEELGKGREASFPEQLQRLDENTEYLVNRNMHLTDASVLKSTGENIRKFYTDGLFQNDLGSAIRYYTDTAFTRGIIRHAQLQSKFSDVYFYQFSYHGQLAGNNGPFFDGAGKIIHGEDLSYLWAFGNGTYLNSLPANDILTSDRYRKLFTNFAKYLNPTPEEDELLENRIWPKVKPDDFQYLNINESLSIEKNPKEELYSKWLELYDQLAVKPYDTF